MTIIKIIIIIVILLLVPYIYIKYRHPFWFTQPVAHYYNLLLPRGYITSIISKPIYDNINIKFIDINSIELIHSSIELLNNNYLPISNNSLDYKLTIDFFNYTLNPPYIIPNVIKNTLKIGMITNNQLIGLITSRPLKIHLYENYIPIFYVDYLCIDKKYRKQNLVQNLILEMANRGFKNEFKSFIFKKEIYPLPFSYITSYNTYILDLSKIEHIDSNNWLKLTDSTTNNIIEKCYQFYLLESKKFKLKQVYTIDEFNYYIISNNYIQTYYLLNNREEIDILVVLFNNQYLLNQSKTLEVYLYLKNNNFNDWGILDQLFGNIEEYKYLYINDIGDNIDITHKYLDLLEYSNKNYIHLYNYYDYKIDKKDILLSFY